MFFAIQEQARFDARLRILLCTRHTPVRLLSPQHWAHTAKDREPLLRGTWCTPVKIASSCIGTNGGSPSELFHWTQTGPMLGLSGPLQNPTGSQHSAPTVSTTGFCGVNSHWLNGKAEHTRGRGGLQGHAHMMMIHANRWWPTVEMTWNMSPSTSRELQSRSQNSPKGGPRGHERLLTD
jgi:hypothetical protein